MNALPQPALFDSKSKSTQFVRCVAVRLGHGVVSLLLLLLDPWPALATGLKTTCGRCLRSAVSFVPFARSIVALYAGLVESTHDPEAMFATSGLNATAPRTW